MTFNEADHPRDRGAFTAKPQTAPESSLTAEPAKTFTVVCHTHEEHSDATTDVIGQFASEELADTWIDENDRSFKHSDCDLWIDFTIPALASA
jgi:dihydrodipicolinate reductase